MGLKKIRFASYSAVGGSELKECVLFTEDLKRKF